MNTSLLVSGERKAVLDGLRKELLRVQGGQLSAAGPATQLRLGPIDEAFTGGCFPVGAVHEFICDNAEDAAATSGFVAAIVQMLQHERGPALWISPSRILFPAALPFFGIAPDQVLFVQLQKDKDQLWALEEALKCEALSCVIAEMPELSFTASRRLQLAVEQSQSTGFLIRRRPRRIQPTACVTRWKISSLPSQPIGDLPGIGCPAWEVALLKVRNGKPGQWQLRWEQQSFQEIHQPAAPTTYLPQRKTG